MQSYAILLPVLAMAALTGLVMSMIPVARFRAAYRRQVSAEDFKFGESADVPPQVSIPNRNYMNLLEAPVLFYVVCVLLYLTAGTTALAVRLAWAYVALRTVHSAIHLTYNNVMHRLVAFALSNAVLVWLWVTAGRHLLTPAAAPLAG